jgi:hypothetical protein
MDREDEAIAHIRLVNGWDESMACEHVDAAFDLWARRNERSWVLDVSMIEGIGITVTRLAEGVEDR